MSKANPPSATQPHHSLFLCSRDRAFPCSFETTGMIGQALGTQTLPERPGRAERHAVGAGREGKAFPSLHLPLAVSAASSPCPTVLCMRDCACSSSPFPLPASQQGAPYRPWKTNVLPPPRLHSKSWMGGKEFPSIFLINAEVLCLP